MDLTRRLLAFALLLTACQERLAAPADCPNLCPGEYVLRDTVLTPTLGADSSYAGYATVTQTNILRVSYQFPVSEDRGVLRFNPRDTTVLVNDTARAYTIDSLQLAFSMVARDTTVHGLVIYLYRLPVTVDSTTTFAEVDAAFQPSAIVDSFVADTYRTRRFSVIYPANKPELQIPPADSGRIAFGVQIRAAQGTGIRIGGVGSGTFTPIFASFVTIVPRDSTDTIPLRRVISPTVGFNTFVSQTTPAIDTTQLTVGGVPVSRALLRFGWPTYLRDSVTLVRASLELVPVGAIPGLVGDTALLASRPLLADFGSKSPTSGDPFFAGIAQLPPGTTDTVRLEVLQSARLWQGTTPLPPALRLEVSPELGGFTRAVFGSSRTAGFVPVLRITYATNFPFTDQ